MRAHTLATPTYPRIPIVCPFFSVVVFARFSWCNGWWPILYKINSVLYAFWWVLSCDPLKDTDTVIDDNSAQFQVWIWTNHKLLFLKQPMNLLQCLSYLDTFTETSTVPDQNVAVVVTWANKDLKFNFRSIFPFWSNNNTTAYCGWCSELKQQKR